MVGGSLSEHNRPWHNLILPAPNQEEMLESVRVISSLPCREEILSAWAVISRFSARWHVDHYDARRGAPADVVWMRGVICETLSQWSREGINAQAPEFHLPPEVLDMLDSYTAWARNCPPVYDVDDRYAFGPGIGGPGQGSPGRAKAYELFKKVPQKFWNPPPLPAYNPMGNVEQWKRRVTALFEKGIREHVREAKARAKVHGLLPLKDKMRAEWHIKAFALYQVGGLSEGEVYDTMCEDFLEKHESHEGANESSFLNLDLGTLIKALPSTSDFLDLPLRKNFRPKQ
jgi:hypothetical protein